MWRVVYGAGVAIKIDLLSFGLSAFNPGIVNPRHCESSNWKIFLGFGRF